MKSKEIIKQIAINAKKASSQLSNIESEIKNKALRNLIKNIKDDSFELIKANKKDIENANSVNLSSAKIDRLMINENRIDGIVKSLEEIINIKDPVGRILSEWNRPNGLKIKKPASILYLAWILDLISLSPILSPLRSDLFFLFL